MYYYIGRSGPIIFKNFEIAGALRGVKEKNKRQKEKTPQSITP